MLDFVPLECRFPRRTSIIVINAPSPRCLARQALSETRRLQHKSRLHQIHFLQARNAQASNWLFSVRGQGKVMIPIHRSGMPCRRGGFAIIMILLL
jgi:hypothetical protein